MQRRSFLAALIGGVAAASLAGVAAQAAVAEPVRAPDGALGEDLAAALDEQDAVHTQYYRRRRRWRRRYYRRGYGRRRGWDRRARPDRER